MAALVTDTAQCLLNIGGVGLACAGLFCAGCCVYSNTWQCGLLRSLKRFVIDAISAVKHLHKGLCGIGKGAFGVHYVAQIATEAGVVDGEAYH